MSLDDSKRSDVVAILQPPSLVEQPVTNRTSSSPVTDEVAILKEGLEQVKENFLGLKRKLDESEGELEKVRIGADVSRNETTFTWELKGVDALMADGPRKTKGSSLFFCSGELIDN